MLELNGMLQGGLCGDRYLNTVPIFTSTRKISLKKKVFVEIDITYIYVDKKNLPQKLFEFKQVFFFSPFEIL